MRLGGARLGAAPQARRFVLQRVYHPDYNNELTQFLPRTVVLKKPPGAQVSAAGPHGRPARVALDLGAAFFPVELKLFSLNWQRGGQSCEGVIRSD